MAHHPRTRRWLAAAVAAALLLGLAALTRQASKQDPLRAAFHAAQNAERYRFRGSTHARVGGVAARYAVSGTGRTDGVLEIEAAAADSAAFPTTFHVAWPEVTGDAGETIEPHALALVVPTGDPLALLASAHAPSDAGFEPVDGHDCRRTDFRLSGRAHMAWWLAHQAYLPVNADSGGTHKLTGSGTLWADPGTGLPCRIVATIDLPRLAGDQPGSGEADWIYGDWQQAESGAQPSSRSP